ncbi:hypothetical protein BDN72DRAFT_905518 [Pluteus cervinus]|uniref:Uncharacterized protein n=1 Tax=Pluteus cervinus TaxID=181527 RepID=A0ACD3A266_9AGAR|nr:hypothetical protein BDN72DRAFT_905518 [Pluteus cervinus]
MSSPQLPLRLSSRPRPLQRTYAVADLSLPRNRNGQQLLPALGLLSSSSQIYIDDVNYPGCIPEFEFRSPILISIPLLSASGGRRRTVIQLSSHLGFDEGFRVITGRMGINPARAILKYRFRTNPQHPDWLRLSNAEDYNRMVTTALQRISLQTTAVQNGRPPVHVEIKRRTKYQSSPRYRDL